MNRYADDTDKADERGFKKLRYNIDKLKSAFVRLIRVVRVPIPSPLNYHFVNSNSLYFGNGQISSSTSISR